MSLAATLRRVRLALAAHPAVAWLLAGVVVVLTVVAVNRAVGQADRARRAWGTSTPVVVATRDLVPGDPVDPTTTRQARLPAPLVPPDALRDLPPDGVAGAAIAAGEPVLARRLAGRTPLPPGTRGVAVAIGPDTPALAVGARVDLAAPIGVVATGAVVVALGPEAATVAVRADELAAVATAVAAGPVVVALAPP